MEEWGAGFAALSDCALLARSGGDFLAFACVGAILGPCLGIGGFYAAFRDWRASRLIAWIPTSKAKGTFVGMIELSGKAVIADSELINARMSGESCVYLRTVVYELRKLGNWKAIYEKEESPRFYLRDETGAVRVDPRGAEITPQVVFDKTFKRSDPQFVDWAFGAKEASNSRGERRFVEYAIPLRSDIYVLGKARSRDDAPAVEVAQDETEPIFLIAVGDEKTTFKRARDLKDLESVAFIGGFALAGLSFRFFYDAFCLGHGFETFSNEAFATAFLIGCVCFGIWTLRALLDYVNSFVEQRRLVDQARSNVDAELKRRADLLPALANAVKGAARRDQDVQETLAALRSEGTILRVDAASSKEEKTRPTALAPRLLALDEKCPQITARASFAKLRQRVVDAETRIALAREFYNNIAQNYETRRRAFPHSLVAAFWRLPKAKFFEAEGFEAKTVDVNWENDATSRSGKQRGIRNKKAIK